MMVLEQHFVFDCALYTQIREQHDFIFGPDLDHGSIRLFLSRNAAPMSVVPQYITCAFKPGCPVSYIWLPTPDRKLR